MALQINIQNVFIFNVGWYEVENNVLISTSLK